MAIFKKLFNTFKMQNKKAITVNFIYLFIYWYNRNLRPITNYDICCVQYN